METAGEKHFQDPHVRYICTETICDMVAYEIRKEIMEDNPTPGISADIQYLDHATRITEEERKKFYTLKAEEISQKDENSIGHKLGRKLFVALKPMMKKYGTTQVIQDILHYPPTREEVNDPALYVQRLTTAQRAPIPEIIITEPEIELIVSELNKRPRLF